MKCANAEDHIIRIEQLRNHFHRRTLYTCMILSDVAKRNSGIKKDDTPQHWSMKKRAVESPRVPIQFCARSPARHVESSMAVNRWEVMLKSMKQLTRNIMAPMQKRVISACDIPSESSVDESPFMSCQNLNILLHKLSCTGALVLLSAFLPAFLLFFVFAIRFILKKSNAKLVEKKVKGNYLTFFL